MKLNACARGEISLAHARDVDAESLDALRWLAHFVGSHGRVDLAICILAGCIALDDRDAWAWHTLGILQRERGNAPAAREAFDRAAQLGGTPPAFQRRPR
jgi:Flp pilus assembly protein TadD